MSEERERKGDNEREKLGRGDREAEIIKKTEEREEKINSERQQ